MSKLELFNEYLTERLTAAAREITSAVERTITDCQDEMSRFKEENERLRLLLDFKPHLHLNTKGMCGRTPVALASYINLVRDEIMMASILVLSTTRFTNWIHIHSPVATWLDS